MPDRDPTHVLYKMRRYWCLLIISQRRLKAKKSLLVDAMDFMELDRQQEQKYNAVRHVKHFSNQCVQKIC
jgi:hypothetical protein